MKTVDNIERQIFNADNRIEIQDILKRWASEIIDECPANALVNVQTADNEPVTGTNQMKPG